LKASPIIPMDGNKVDNAIVTEANFQLTLISDWFPLVDSTVDSLCNAEGKDEYRRKESNDAI
jgi:hypothetical protein